MVPSLKFGWGTCDPYHRDGMRGGSVFFRWPEGTTCPCRRTRAVVTMRVAVHSFPSNISRALLKLGRRGSMEAGLISPSIS